MSIEKRNSPARKRRLVQGRGRVAVLVAGAAVLGGGVGAVGVPAAIKDPDHPACQDPSRTTATVTVEGQEIDCEPEQTTAAGDPAPAPPAPPAEEPEVSVPSPGADPGQEDDGIDGNVDSPSEGGGSSSSSGSSSAAAEEPDEPMGRIRGDGDGDGDDGDGKKKSGKDDGPTDAEVYASLPAEWTSLTPIVLPAFGVDEFPIPPYLLPLFQAAGAEYGIPWEILASINEIETNFGRNAGVSSAGALGWMQFMPSSWETWGRDGDGDRRRDPRHPVDAIFAAARYLYDAGAATDLPRAIFAYNHADWYVRRVVERAREFAGLDQDTVAALSERALRENAKLYQAKGNPFFGDGAIPLKPGQALLLSKKALTRIVLKNDQVKVYDCGREDVRSGRIDRRVLATLVFLARSGMQPTVTSIHCGHSRYTTSGNVSAHSYGHAVDIAKINDTSIMGHQGAGSVTEAAVQRLARLQGYMRPNQIISLMTIQNASNTIAMGDHADHIHVGFPRVAKVRNLDRPKDVKDIAAVIRTP